MKVKEMRHWFTDFGDRQKNGNNQSLASKDNLISDVVDGVDKLLESTQTEMAELNLKTPPGHNPEVEKESFNTPEPKKIQESLLLQKNPSTDPTVATHEDYSPQKTTASWCETNLASSWDNDDFPDPEPSLGTSPASSFDASMESNIISESSEYDLRQMDSNENSKSNGNLKEFKNGNANLDWLQRSYQSTAPPSKVFVNDYVSTTTACSSAGSAKIFGNTTLTARTLDFLCNDEKTPSCTYYQVNDPVTQDEDTAASIRSEGRSIYPGALDSNLVQVFLDSYPVNDGVQHQAGYKLAKRTIPRCKKIDPCDLEFLNPSKSQTTTKAVPKHHSCREHRSTVSQGIVKFGGPKQSLIEQRKQQLEKIWADNKEATHVKKIKWDICQRTGKYKKKLVLETREK